MEGECKVRGPPKILGGKIFWGHLYKCKRERVQMSSSLYSIARQVIKSGARFITVCSTSGEIISVRGSICNWSNVVVLRLVDPGGSLSHFSITALSPEKTIKLHKVTEWVWGKTEASCSSLPLFQPLISISFSFWFTWLFLSLGAWTLL